MLLVNELGGIELIYQTKVIIATRCSSLLEDFQEPICADCFFIIIITSTNHIREKGAF